MIKLFELLFYGHVHKWDYIRLTSEPDPQDKGLPDIVYRVYTCKQCCTIKRVKVWPLLPYTTNIKKPLT